MPYCISESTCTHLDTSLPASKTVWPKLPTSLQSFTFQAESQCGIVGQLRSYLPSPSPQSHLATLQLSNVLLPEQCCPLSVSSLNCIIVCTSQCKAFLFHQNLILLVIGPCKFVNISLHMTRGLFSLHFDSNDSPKFLLISIRIKYQ